MRVFIKWICLMNWIIFVVIGCNMFKDVALQRSLNKNDDKASKSTQLTSSWEGLKEMSYFTLVRDSGSRQYQVMLWPKGPFSFTEDGGFTGEAEKVMITGNVSSVNTSTGLMKGMEKLNGDVQVKSDENHTAVATSKTESQTKTVSWKWCLIAGIVVVAFGIWLYKKSKRAPVF
ncbi:hypothetical protein PBAL39_15709 [Pedobacter sp. BAL39]|nr:hypothetical protein PBAL39_15709 [Pedobacter sp. BAL39]